MKMLVICSGGLDSVTLAQKVAKEHHLLGLLSFDYGQRHKKELSFAAACANRLGVRHDVIDISGIGALLSGSALTDGVAVPDGHYAEDSMKITIVPNRNPIMLTIAYGAAAARGADAVAAAFHGGDHFIYPDCRPEFVNAFAEMQNKALADFASVSLYTPFVTMSKADIVREGDRLETAFQDTWSCYKGGQHHCGRCGTCVERQEAFHVAGVKDPTFYEDSHFWQGAVAEAKMKGLG